MNRHRADSDERVDAVHDYWFGEIRDGFTVEDREGLWYGGQPATDADIRERFLALAEEAATGALDGWTASPRGRLALVVVLDQFSRNLWRGTPRAFAQDPKARAACRDGLAAGDDERLSLIERSFLYMPLEHSEVLVDQERCVALFQRLAALAPVARAKDMAAKLDYAVRHRDIVARFGRFPHRNAILGRASTPEEIEFLKRPGSGF